MHLGRASYALEPNVPDREEIGTTAGSAMVMKTDSLEERPFSSCGVVM
jgi:hypothetical protein